MRETLKSAARTGGEEMSACRIVELSGAQAQIAENFCLILYFCVLFGPLKPEVEEEEVAEFNFGAVLCISHPPCFPPKSPTQSAGPPT